MARKRDLFVHHHASSLSEMHGQINQNHSNFILTVVVVEVVKGCSFEFKQLNTDYCQIGGNSKCRIVKERRYKRSNWNQILMLSWQNTYLYQVRFKIDLSQFSSSTS